MHNRKIKILVRSSSGLLSMVRLQQSSKSFATDNRPVAGAVVRPIDRKRNHVADSLVRSVGVKMLEIFADGMTERRFTKEDHALQALFLEAAMERAEKGGQKKGSGVFLLDGAGCMA